MAMAIRANMSMDAAGWFRLSGPGHDLPMRQDLKLFDPRFMAWCGTTEALGHATVAGFGGTKNLPGVCPAWDNEARRPGRGICFKGSTPALTGRGCGQPAWPRCAILPAANSLVFVNA